MPLNKDVGNWIKDFMKSDAPQFKGKSKEERKNMALAAYREKYGSLEEGKQLDIEDFAKVVQAVTKTGHPVTVLLTPKFNEIEVLTGMNAPEDMLRDLSIAVDSLGYGRNDIIIAGDSSNLSRREYSDIHRVNGGHRDYFEKSVNEAQFTDYSNQELAAYVKNTKDKEAAKELHKRSQKLKGLSRTDVNEQADHVAPMVVKAYKEYLEAKKDGDGEKAYRYYSKKLNNTYSTRVDRDAIEAILKKKYGSALKEATKDEETKFHKKLDKLVHDTFGKRKGEMEEGMSLDDQAKAYYLEKLKKGEIDTLPEDPKAAFLAQMTKDQIAHDEETLRRERGLEEKSGSNKGRFDKADLDKDGKLSSYEKKRGAAIEKAMMKAKSLKKESDDTPEEQKATNLSIAAEKAKIAASQKKIQNLSKGVAEQQLNEGMGWDYEGKMAQAQLLSIVKNARDLFQMIDSNTQLKSWVQSKLTKAEDYLSSVRTYLEGESLTNTTPLVVSENRMTDDEGVGLNIGDVVKAADGGIYQIIYSYSEGKPFMVPFDLKRRRPTSLASKTYFDQGDILTKRMTEVLDYSATKGGFMK